MSSVADRPIHVSATIDTKSLFKISGDPRVRYALASDPAAPAPDVLVVPAPKPDIDFDGLIASAPAGCWARVAAGQTLLVFDASTEGHPHDASQTERLLQFLADNGLPRARTVMVTQDRTWRQVHEWWMDRKARGAPIHVLNYDYFLKALVRSHETDGAAEFERRKTAFEARGAARERRYVCLNYTPRPAKVAFLLRLLHDGFWEDGFVSFGGFAPMDSGRATRAEVIRERLRQSRDFGGMMTHLEDDFDRLDAMGPRYLSGHQRHLQKAGVAKTPTWDEHLAEHDRSWFTIVPETEIEGPRRITEKTLKPLLGFHPAIVLGNAGSLGLLRELGFRSFYGYFDEGYDEEPQARRRFIRVYSELMRLCRLEEAELARMEREWTEVLVHNAWWGLTGLPDHYRTVIDPAFIDEIAGLLGR